MIGLLKEQTKRKSDEAKIASLEVKIAALRTQVETGPVIAKIYKHRAAIRLIKWGNK